MQSFLEVLERAGVNAWLKNLETGDVSSTPGFWRELGYPHEMARDVLSWRAHIHPDDLPSYMAALEGLRRSQQDGLKMTFRFRSADDTWQVIEARGRVIERASDGQPQLFAGILSDRTEEIRRDAKARTDHARLAAAQERAGAGIWEVDIRTGMVTLDARSLELHGLPSDLAQPMDQSQWAAALDANGADDVVAAFQKAVETGTLYSYEYSTSGGKTWIQGFGSAVYENDEGGEPIKMVGLNLDVTERRKAERLIEQMRGELVHLARVSAMGSMASTIAHELNQPLAATANYLSVAEMLINKEEVDQSLRSAVADAMQATLKAGDIIRRIREGMTSRSSARQRAELKPVLQSGIRLATIDATQRGIEIQTRLRSGVFANIEAVQIEQVMINLVRNAMDALEGCSRRKLTVRLYTVDEEAVVEVSDTGIGVPEEMIPAVFETFASSKEHGTGLGLSICRTIIEAHDGRIELRSTSSRGTTFLFRLPLQKSAS